MLMSNVVAGAGGAPTAACSAFLLGQSGAVDEMSLAFMAMNASKASPLSSGYVPLVNALFEKVGIRDALSDGYIADKTDATNKLSTRFNEAVQKAVESARTSRPEPVVNDFVDEHCDIAPFRGFVGVGLLAREAANDYLKAVLASAETMVKPEYRNAKEEIVHDEIRRGEIVQYGGIAIGALAIIGVILSAVFMQHGWQSALSCLGIGGVGATSAIFGIHYFQKHTLKIVLGHLNDLLSGALTFSKSETILRGLDL